MNNGLNDEQMDTALWRYGVISPLLHHEANELSLGVILEEITQRRYVRPGGTDVQLSADTIRKWLYRYRQGGLPALANQHRSDKGNYQIPPGLIEKLFELRKEHPRWTLAGLLEHMVKIGQWNGTRPSRSALYRYAKAHNLKRDPHVKGTVDARAFAFDAFGQLWTADFLHGPKLREKQQKRKAYLHVIIDDCTRYVVSGAFYLAETVQTLMSELLIAVRRFGIPRRFYTDNGACYASRHLKIVCARLGTALVHTPPYRPQGRGKVERFFRTVQDQFLASNESKTLDDINQAFGKWLAEYHQRLHHTLKCSPVEKRMKVENLCKAVPEVIDIEALFRMERRCRVYHDGTIRLFGHRFEVPGSLPGSRCTAFYVPWDLSRVYYGEDMRLARPLNRHANAYRFEHPNKGASK
jgi:putative transposase